VAFATGARDDPQELLGSAEVARSEARRAGGRRIIVFDRPARSNIADRFEMTQALHRAVEQHELSLDYQPIVHLASMATVGLEALLRWNPRGRGQVRPDTFIPLAEDSGLIVPIGSWVLGEVVEQWSDWVPANRGLAPPWVTVNVSVAQLDVGFAGLADDLLAAQSALPGRLSVEITESRLTIDPEGARATLNWLRRLGVKVILDDFGTGYSSLLSLCSFPVDALKIDRSFVEHLLESDRDQAIVGTIIDLAHTLGILVIAEGVESAAQLECLAGLSCDQAQGFYISPPAPLDEVRAAYETASPLGQRSMGRD
jgi:EAL domain-containing protein (putative c-di-GMP-specific phosphodiesterase class I)